MNLIELMEQVPVSWSAVTSRLASHPEDAEQLQSRSGETCLFVAIDRKAPATIIRDLLSACPSAAMDVNWRTGLTILHLAVARGSDPQCVRLLLAQWPAAAKGKMRSGCAPLHSAQHIETAKMLVAAYPASVRMTNDAGYLPIHRVAYAGNAPVGVLEYLIEEGKKVNVGGRHGGGGVLVPTKHGVTPLRAAIDVIDKGLLAKHFADPSLSQEAQFIWDKFRVVARAASEALAERRGLKAATRTKEQKASSDYGYFFLLHAAVELGCPDLIVRRALLEHPEQARMADRWGRSVLSIAAASADPLATVRVVRSLLQPPHGSRRNATVIDADGRLPLHWYVAGGRRRFDHGMVALIAAAPKALETRDGKEHLYPFMLAAVGEDSSIDAVYNLLRETPWLVSRDFGDRGRREGAPAQGTMPSSKGHLLYSSMILLPVAFLIVLVVANHMLFPVFMHPCHAFVWEQPDISIKVP